MNTAIAPLRHEIRMGREVIGASQLTVKQIENRPVLNATVPLDRVPQADYYAPIDVIRSRGDDLSPLFTGTVDEARKRDGQVLEISAASMADFAEFGMGAVAHYRMPVIDLIYMLARTSGLSDDKVQIDVEPAPPAETFEVLIPVNGCSIQTAVRLTPTVRLVPPNPSLLDRFLENTGLDELRAEMLAAEAWAATYVTSRRVYEAEELGRRDIETATALLTAALRNGSTLDERGKIRDFRRSSSRALPMTGSTVVVSGLMTHRAWMRNVVPVPIPIAIDGAEIPNLSVVAKRASSVDIASYISLWRAATESTSPLLRLTALWDALEFYASGVDPDITFTKAERRAIRSSLPVELAGEKRERVVEVLQGLNSSPLRARVDKRARASGVLLTVTDWEQLRRLREARNDAVHGRQKGEVSREDLAYGVSIVSRLLLQAVSGSR